MPISQKIGWRSYVSPLSSLLTSIYGVWNADTASTVTTLGNGTFAAWNAEDVITATQLATNISGAWNGEALGTSLDTSVHRVYNGDNVNDSSGNAQNGTNVGGVTFTTGKIGNAFTFNGSNYISLPNNTFKFTGDFSVSLWFYCKTSSNAQTLINGYDYTGSLSGGWVLASFSTGYMEFQTYVNTQATSKSRYQVPFNTGTYNNQWVHITLTRASGTSTKIYINGTEASGSFSKGSVTDNPTYLTNCYSEIGGDFVTSGGLINPCDNGTKIDAVTVWNKALTADEVTSLYNTGTGAEYPFSSQLLPSTNDAVSTNHGTLMNGASFTAGKIGKAFSFDGVNDYIALPDNSLNFTGDFSYSFWIKATDTTGYTVIVGNIQGARAPYGFAHGYQFWLQYNKISIGFRDGMDSTNYGLDSVANVATGSWNHVVITYKYTLGNTNGAKIYINGVLDSSRSVPNSTNFYSSPMKACIGARNQAGAPEYFLSNGTSLDAMSVWNKELTATEISALYNSGNAQQYPFSDVTLSGVTSDALGIYNGTNNGVTFTTGKTGTSAFSFNGSTNYIALPQAALNFNKGNSGQSIGDFSVSFWLNLNTGSSDYQTVIGNWGDNGRGWQVVMFGGSFTFFGSDGSNGSTARIQHSLGLSKSNAINQWVHVVVTYTNQSQVKSYVNGVLTNTTSTTYQIRTNERNNGNLGCYPQSGDNSSTKYWFLNGKLDAVTLWTKALTDAEASALYNNGTGYQYSFPSSATGYLSSYNDAVGTNHGTLTNGCTFATGKIGQAFTFDGVNDYVALPNTSMNINGNFSISCWVNFSSLPSVSTIISNYYRLPPYTRYYGWSILMIGDKVTFDSFNGVNASYHRIQSTSISLNTWNHVVVNYQQGGTTTIYVNGVLVGSGSTTTPIGYSGNETPAIGGTLPGDGFRYPTNGKIDALSAWNKELTAEEVTNLYNSGNGKQYPNY